MKHIASRTNPFYKQLRKLARPGGARQDGLVWLEGVHLCQEYLQRVGLPRHAVFDAARLAEPELAALIAGLPPERSLSLEGGLLDQVSEVAAAQGVGFLIDLPQPALPDRLTETCVLLDGVQDPGNVGSIIRTCAAAGVAQVLLLAGSASAWSPKVLRAGQGAHFALTVFDQVDPSVAAARLALPLVATSLDAAQNLYRATLPESCAWIFGHEGRGVGADWLRRAQLRVLIPQASGVESLNVAAAVAVCLFEHRRRRLMG